MDWVSRISVFCFAASYGVSLALEATRFWFRSGVRGAVMLGFAAAGLAAHSMFLVVRARDASSIPLSSAFDWYLLAAWLLAASYMYLALHQRQSAIGVFLLPVVLGLIGLSQFADRQPFSREPASYAWGMIHGVFLLLGTVAAAVGAIAGTMYLFQDYRLRQKLPPPAGVRLPSLEWLDRTAFRGVTAAVPLCGLGFLSGAILNVVNQRRSADFLQWNDPVIWASTLLFFGMVTALTLTYRNPLPHRGRRVAYLTIVNFVLVLAVLGVSMFSSTGHGSGRPTANPHATGIFSTEPLDNGPLRRDIIGRV